MNSETRAREKDETFSASATLLSMHLSFGLIARLYVRCTRSSGLTMSSWCNVAFACDFGIITLYDDDFYDELYVRYSQLGRKGERVSMRA